ncbi:hypothetical protein ABPG77_009978 [Micractinium sp. CCAP 211/92]
MATSAQTLEAAVAPSLEPSGSIRDPLRDGLLRYLAFTSDVGEAFKAFISRRLYLGSYAVVALYGAVDTADKGQRAYARALAAQRAPATTPFACQLPAGSCPASAAAVAGATCLPGAPPALLYRAHAASISERLSHSVAAPVAAAVLDTALWHAAASLAIPAALINRTVWAVRQLATRPAVAARLHPRAAALLPPAAGLAMIPLAVHHIDEGVTRWMDVHLRPHLPRDAQPESSHRHFAH